MSLSQDERIYHVVYGVPLDTPSGGTKLQLQLFHELEKHSSAPIATHTVTSYAEAKSMSQIIQALPTDKQVCLIIDGIALLWLGEYLEHFRSLEHVLLVGLVHYPFSVEW
jgi:hypothetical protein